MNLKLWLRLFINQVLISLAIIALLLIIFYTQLPQFDLLYLYYLKFWNVRLFIWVIAFVLSISAIYTLHISFSLNNAYELIRAKLNWLLLGKYHHPIFRQEIEKRSWYDNDYIVSHDINRLRGRLLDLTEDLQEFTAAPVFVGEETKEEIIELERSRIARELHDSVSQQLFAAMMMLSAVTENFEEGEDCKIGPALKKVEDVIGNAQTEMRALLLHLRPVDLQGKSLKQGVHQLLLELQAKIPLQLTWELDDPKLEFGIEDHLFRIIQEAVSNTMRHARANKLDVYLRESTDFINIRIVDDGIGFESHNTQKVGSYGLKNIQERVKGMGGVASFISSPGQGTVVDIKIPYKPVKIAEKEKEKIND